MAKARYGYDDYLKEARPAPFVLSIAHDDQIEIHAPDGTTALRIEDATSSREVLRLLCGEHFDRIMELFGDKPFTALNRLATDMREHFNFTGDVQGGTGASSTP